MKGKVYFIGSGTSGPVKIGYSRSLGGVQSRLSSLQTGSHKKLTVLGVVNATQRDERRFHQELEQHQVKGEWFEREPAEILLEELLGQSSGRSTSQKVVMRRRYVDTDWEGKLYLEWEPSGSPISDNFTPHEVSAAQLWNLWREKEVPESGVVPISWFVAGPGFFESLAYGHQAGYGELYGYFSHPLNENGETINWLSLPVRDKQWNLQQWDKGGFIQEVLGWKPSPFQQYMDVDVLFDASIGRRVL